MLKNKFSIKEAVSNNNNKTQSKKPSVLDYSIAQLEGEKKAYLEEGKAMPTSVQLEELNAFAKVFNIKPLAHWTMMDWGNVLAKELDNTKLTSDQILKKVNDILKSQS